MTERSVNLRFDSRIVAWRVRHRRRQELDPYQRACGDVALLDPFQMGIDFYNESIPNELISAEWVDEVATEAFEAAREIIVPAVDELADVWVRHRPVLDAIAEVSP